MPTPSVLSTSNAVLPVNEGSDAIVSYTFTTALTGNASFAVTLQDWEASFSADLVGLSVRSVTGAGPGSWIPITRDVAFSIIAGSTGFDVKTFARQDDIAELPERFTVVARQTEVSTIVADSWWVSRTVQISAAPGSGAFSTSITAAPSSNVDEGQNASATYTLAQALSSDVVVRAALDVGNASSSDFTGFTYTIGIVTNSVPPDGLITIPAGTVSFSLQTTLNTDSETTESGEAIVFIVSQTESTHLTNSWWVTSQINIGDVQPAPGIGASSAVINAVQAATNVGEGSYAVAEFALSAALGTDAHVNVSLGGANINTDDYGPLQFNIGLGYSNVGETGVIAIPAGATTFQLRTLTASEVVDIGEASSIVFAVSQVNGATNLQNSWWVTSEANITNVNPNNAPVITVNTQSASITENNTNAAVLRNGNFTFQDIDLSNSHTVTISSAVVTASPNAAGLPPADGYGIFSASVVENTSDLNAQGAVNWTFTVNDSALRSLPEGATVTQAYTLTLQDSAPAAANHPVTVTVTLIGIGDA